MDRGRPPGTFKISNRKRSFEILNDPWCGLGEKRVERILASIQSDIDEGGTCRVRQILTSPRELYRLELERPDFSYERTTILDAQALEELLTLLPRKIVEDRFLFS